MDLGWTLDDPWMDARWPPTCPHMAVNRPRILSFSCSWYQHHDMMIMIPWSWLHDDGVIMMISWSWYHGHHFMMMVSSWWYHDHDTVIMTSWWWCHHHDIMIMTPWSWRRDDGVLMIRAFWGHFGCSLEASWEDFPTILGLWWVQKSAWRVFAGFVEAGSRFSIFLPTHFGRFWRGFGEVLERILEIFCYLLWI